MRYTAIFASVVTTLLANATCWGSTEWPGQKLNIRESATDYEVSIGFAPNSNKLVNFTNGENCGSNHKTSPPTPGAPRYYNHFHTAWTLPASGSSLQGVEDDMVTWHDVNAITVRSFWDNYYGHSYTGTGTEDAATNCHSHSTGKPVWVQDPTYIFEDEYKTVVTETNVTVVDGTAHSIKVLDTEVVVVGEGPGYIAWATSEKNNESRIYNKDWQDGIFGGGPPGDGKQKK